MLDSIQKFIDFGVDNLQKASKDFSDNPGNFADISVALKRKQPELKGSKK